MSAAADAAAAADGRYSDDETWGGANERAMISRDGLIESFFSTTCSDEDDTRAGKRGLLLLQY